MTAAQYELAAPAKPLTGFKVVEVGHSIAAAYAGMILGELGADVVKVGNPRNGDGARSGGPLVSADGAASAFEACNRAKRGAAIKLTSSDGQHQLRRPVEGGCDVVIHTLRFGAMSRLGLWGAASASTVRRMKARRRG